MLDEQAETQDAEINQTEGAESASVPSEGIKDILGSALKAGTATETAESVESEGQGQEETHPWLELVIGDAQKVSFKTEEDFEKFLESNKVLKDGWMRQADYTRKTQEIAKLKEEFEVEKQGSEKVWGEQKPDAQSLNALASVWKMYATGDAQTQDLINQFVTDVHLMANGKEPVGPLRGNVDQSTNSQSVQDPVLLNKIATLERELHQFKSQSEQERQQAIKAREEREAKEAESAVDQWLAEKAKAKVSISRDELVSMADLMSIVDEKGQNKFTLDEAYTMTLAKLGKLKNQVAKEVIKDADRARKKAPFVPGSKSSSAEPEPSTIKGILNAGIKSLAGE